MPSFAGLRQTFRKLWAQKGFSAAVVVILALGIGGTVSVFSIIYAVLLRPLPYANPQQLVSVFQSKLPNDEADQSNFSPANFVDFREKSLSFTDMAAYCGFHYNLITGTEPEQVEGVAVSASFFNILGVRPSLGRNFLPSEDSYSSPRVVILSDRLWSEDFHRDPTIVGKSIVLNGDPFYVVGVMPRTFRPPDDDQTSLWVPLQQQIRPDRMLGRDQQYLGVVARLRPDIQLDQARGDMNRIAAQLHSAYPNADMGSGAVVMPLQQALAGGMQKSLFSIAWHCYFCAANREQQCCNLDARSNQQSGSRIGGTSCFRRNTAAHRHGAFVREYHSWTGLRHTWSACRARCGEDLPLLCVRCISPWFDRNQPRCSWLYGCYLSGCRFRIWPVSGTHTRPTRYSKDSSPIRERIHDSRWRALPQRCAGNRRSRAFHSFARGHRAIAPQYAELAKPVLGLSY